MNYYHYTLSIIIFLNINCLSIGHEIFDWCVVGGGPAGISAVAVLIDNGVQQNSILWLDKEFNVGRMGQYYANVPSNNRAEDFVAFINSCQAFKPISCKALDELRKIDMKKFCNLSVIIEPLKCITDYFRTKVIAIKDELIELYSFKNVWNIGTTSELYRAKHVILATGCHPKELAYENNKIIPLDKALDFETLKKMVKRDDIVGVIGGSHSAILILKYLSQIDVKQINNYYRHPIVYASEMEYDFSIEGLRGTTAQWAKEVLEVNPPKNLTREQIFYNDCLKGKLTKCTKIIYAIGYERNLLPHINGNNNIDYDKTSGIIAPCLFGLGIAFPEQIIEDGKVLSKIGIGHFIDFVSRMLPQWMSGKTKSLNDKIKSSKELSSLFSIYVL